MEVLATLRSSSHTVRALTRSADNHRTLLEAGADEVTVGNLLDAEAAADAVEAVDAVVCVVGTPLGLAAVGGPLVDGEGTINLIDAAEAAGVDRFVLETSIGVGSSRSGVPLVFRLVFDAFGILEAKERAEDHLRAAELAHTIVRPGGLTNDPATGELLVAEGGDTVSGTVPRADVARLMVAALDTPESEGRTFEVVAREGARGSPRGVVDVPWAAPVG